MLANLQLNEVVHSACGTRVKNAAAFDHRCIHSIRLLAMLLKLAQSQLVRTQREANETTIKNAAAHAPIRCVMITHKPPNCQSAQGTNAVCNT